MIDTKKILYLVNKNGNQVFKVFKLCLGNDDNYFLTTAQFCDLLNEINVKGIDFHMKYLN